MGSWGGFRASRERSPARRGRGPGEALPSTEGHLLRESRCCLLPASPLHTPGSAVSPTDSPVLTQSPGSSVETSARTGLQMCSVVPENHLCGLDSGHVHSLSPHAAIPSWVACPAGSCPHVGGATLPGWVGWVGFPPMGVYGVLMGVGNILKLWVFWSQLLGSF